MAYSVTQSFVSGQPPLLVFTICLMAFGLTMVVLAYLIGEHEVPNPDVRMDWNKLLLKISDFQMCILPHHLRRVKETLSSLPVHRSLDLPSINSTFNSSSSHIIDESKSMSAVLSDVVDRATDGKGDDTSLTNISVKVIFGVKSFNFPSSISHFKGNIKGTQLGFKGKFSSHIFNLLISFQPILNETCNARCHIIQEVCLTLDLPSALLSQTKSPDKCEMLSETGPPIFVELDAKGSIPQGSCLIFDYTPDATLTEMLSLHDRSIVNLHLMHTSYFMFVMVMTLLCYSLIKGRYRHPKGPLPPEKIPLDA